MSSSILGIVLAGGRSSRMGRDKAHLRFSASTLADRAVARLRPQVGRVAFNGAADGDDGHRDAPRPKDVVWLTDPIEGRLGPLAGILAGLRHAQSAGMSHVASVPVDAPFFPPDLVMRLSDSLGLERARIAVAASAGAMHPVFALWPAHLADDLDRFVRTDGKRRVRGFIESHPHLVVAFPLLTLQDGLAPIDPFLNLNQPEDVRNAEAVLARLDGANP